MIDLYISDIFLQMISQIFLLGVFFWMIYPCIQKDKKNTIIIIIYTIFSIIFIYNILLNIAASVVFLIVFELANPKSHRLFLLLCFLGYILINQMVLYIQFNQETLFYMMLKLIAVDCYVFIYQIYTIFRTNKNYLQVLFITQILLFVFCMGSNIIILATVNKITSSIKEILYFPVFSVSLLYVFLSILLYHSIQKQKLIEMAEIQKIKNELTKKQYLSLKEKYEDISILKHDIKNHLQTLYILIEQNKQEDMKNYLCQYLVNINEYSLHFHSSHQMFEILINEKYNEACKRNIDFIVDYKDFDFTFIEDIDIVSIFANALDNAIEANEGFENNKYIKIITSYKNNYSIFKIENSYSQLFKEDGQLLSTKKNHQGMGITSIKKTVSKYRGILSYEIDDNVFSLTIMIPFKQ